MRRTFDFFVLAQLCNRCNGWSATSVRRRSLLSTVATATYALVVPQATATATADPYTIWKPASVETLIPILELKNTVSRLLDVTQEDTSNSSILTLITSIPSEEKFFKNIFDAYSDPVSYKQKFVDQNAFLVYYTKGFDGPGRPSIESDLPVKQTLQYGSRNDAWVAYNDFLTEFTYQQQNTAEANAADLVRPLKEMINALDQYLSLASSEQIASALKTISSK